MTGPVFKARADPRLTAVGQLLRRLSIDELPQLWNVIVGDMSLVGPRPPLPDEVSRYEPWQRRRLSMKPGLTCLWQVSGSSELDFDRWMALDLKYIDTWSPLLDLKILLKTVPAVLAAGARARDAAGSAAVYLFPPLSSAGPSEALYMYLIEAFGTSRFGPLSRFTFRQALSYHSIQPWIFSPSVSTTTIGVLAAICLR